MAYEADIEKKIIGAMAGFKKGTKTAKDVVVLIKKLRESNTLMADSYNKELVEAINKKK